jgi:hypothetical protein
MRLLRFARKDSKKKRGSLESDPRFISNNYFTVMVIGAELTF